MITREEFIKIADDNSLYISSLERRSDDSDISAWSNRYPWLVFKSSGFVIFQNWLEDTNEKYYNLEELKSKIPNIKFAIKKKNVNLKLQELERDFV